MEDSGERACFHQPRRYGAGGRPAGEGSLDVAVYVRVGTAGCTRGRPVAESQAGLGGQSAEVGRRRPAAQGVRVGTGPPTPRPLGKKTQEVRMHFLGLSVSTTLSYILFSNPHKVTLTNIKANYPIDFIFSAS